MRHAAPEEASAFIEACHRLGRERLVTASAGNLSWRHAESHFLISGSGSWLAEIAPDKLAVCRVADGALIEGARPSMETGFHAGILRARPDCRVVLHFQSLHATAIACTPPEGTKAFDLIPELPFHVGRVAIVPYHEPGSAELARAVTAALARHNLALLENHGQVTVGRDFAEALKRALFFEFACGLLCASGGRARPMAGEAATRLRERSGTI